MAHKTLSFILWLYLFCAALVIFPFSLGAVVDENSNGLSDIWELVYAAGSLLPEADADWDGMTNEEESIVGTDPFDASSLLRVHFDMNGDGSVSLSCLEANPKRYDIFYRESLAGGDWSLVEGFVSHVPFTFTENLRGGQGFYRVVVGEADSDGDGVSDWEEVQLGFDPLRAHTGRFSDDDHELVTDALAEGNVISLHVIDGDTYENWPDPATFVIRRSSGLEPLSVGLSFSGSASAGDYVGPSETIHLPAGIGETYLSIQPVDDAISEGEESLTISLVDGAGYDLGSASSGTIRIHDSGAGVSAKEASRFLAQSSFGATLSDIASVQSFGIGGWIDEQISLGPTLLQTTTEAMRAIDDADDTIGFYSESKLVAWWKHAMEADDQLRQRVAYALSQILVVSDDASMIRGEPVGIANYYDIFVRNAFGNYRDILEEVTYHPIMGVYLSHLANRAPDPSIGRFPDENYAREIMQLFTIGLWMLNNDGSRVLDEDGEPIPTYTNFEISELARVFTGMAWGTRDPLIWWTFSSYPGQSETNPYTVPMQFWEGRAFDTVNGVWLPYQVWLDGQLTDMHHRDKNPKTIVTGAVIPAGQLGEEDVDQALDVLFNHPNMGPFLAIRLIQRLVKSNPSPAYINRVASVFNDNGSGSRGDMGAVIRAILMDAEARDFAYIDDVDNGKQREPYLRFVSLLRTVGVSVPSGVYPILWREDQFAQQPLSSPTVFNFYRPDYTPSGPVRDAGLVAPEFQITTTVSAMETPNQFYWMTRNRGISSYQNVRIENPDGSFSWVPGPYHVTLDYGDELPLADDPDALLAQLDLLFTYGTLSPAQQGIIRFAVQRRIDQGWSDNDKVALALYLLMTSPDFIIQK